MKGYQLLIVDDDRDMLTLLKNKFEAHDFSVLIAESATEALREISANRVDLIITDIKMRGMTGLQFCQQVVESDPEMPVLILTGFGTLDTAVAAIRAGAYDFLVKPINLDSTVALVDRALKNVKAKKAIVASPEGALLPVEAVERRHILAVLEALHGNKAMAAKKLGLDRKTLYRKLDLYGYKN